MKAKGKGWIMIRKIAVSTSRENGHINVALSAKEDDLPSDILITGDSEKMLELCKRILEEVNSFRAAILVGRIPEPEKAEGDGR